MRAANVIEVEKGRRENAALSLQSSLRTYRGSTVPSLRAASSAMNYCRPPSRATPNTLSLKGHVPGYLCNNFAGSQDITCHYK